MYNKLFVKILDSSIWLEPTTTRIVWITLLAAMDQDGYAHFSATENLATRARVSVEDCAKAIEILESPDRNSGDPSNEGRRIERVPGGFMILNAPKYRDTLNKTMERERTRIRVAKHRAKKHVTETVTGVLHPVTPKVGNVTVTPVTPSVSYSDSEAEASVHAHSSSPKSMGNGSAAAKNGESARVSVDEKQRAQVDARMGWLKGELCRFYGRPEGRSDYAEDCLLVEVCRRAEVKGEFGTISEYRSRLPPKDRRYFPQSMARLLEKWDDVLDRARSHVIPAEDKTIIMKQLDQACRDSERL